MENAGRCLQPREPAALAARQPRGRNSPLFCALLRQGWQGATGEPWFNFALAFTTGRGAWRGLGGTLCHLTGMVCAPLGSSNHRHGQIYGKKAESMAQL